MSEYMTKIGELRTYSRRVNLIAKVLQIGETREVSSSSDGRLHQVVEALIGDETGTILLTLWDENVERFTPGDVVEVDNGYAGTFKGSLRLNIGKYGNIEKASREVPNVNEQNNLSDKQLETDYRQRRRY